MSDVPNPMFQRVVVFDDLQPHASAADVVMEGLARRLPGLVAHVAFALGPGAGHDDSLAASEISQVVAPLARAVDRLRERGVDAHAHAARGSAFDVVLDVIDELQTDLVIIPTAATHSIVKRVSNSTTGRALRHSAAPVLLIGPGFRAATWPGLDRVLHPVANPFADEGDAGLAFAAQVARALGADLQLAHAYRPADDEQGLDDATRAEIEESVGGRAVAGLLGQARALEGLEASAVALRGAHPGQALVGHAITQGVGLIVMPAFEPGFTHVTVRGSVTEWLLRHAPCPVLVQGHPHVAPADAATAMSQLIHDWLGQGDGLG